MLTPSDAGALAARLSTAFADQDRVSTAYDAEALLSSVLGRLRMGGYRGDLLRGLCLDLCDTLAADESSVATGILRTFATVGIDDEVRDHGAALAAKADQAAPAWAAELGQAIPGACWLATDEYGESVTCTAEFSYPTPGDRHSLVVRVDPLWHGAITSMGAPYMTEEKSDVRGIVKLAGKLGVGMRDLPPGEGAALLRTGVNELIHRDSAPWMERDPEDFQDTMGLLAVAGQRVRALAAAGADDVSGEAAPAGMEPAAVVAGRWPEEERERLVAEFRGSPEAQGLEGPVAGFLPKDIVDLCVDCLGRDPLRPGPLLFRRLLEDVIPARLIIPVRVADQVPPVVKAWATWITDRVDLPKKLRRRMMSDLKDPLREFPATLAAAGALPSSRYYQDFPDDVLADDIRCQRAIERRHIAVPLPHDRPEGADNADAAEPQGRSEITRLWLAEREVPLGEWQAYQALVEVLWDDDQADVTDQALRMLHDGTDRAAILDELARQPLEAASRPAAESS